MPTTHDNWQLLTNDEWPWPANPIPHESWMTNDRIGWPQSQTTDHRPLTTDDWRKWPRDHWPLSLTWSKRIYYGQYILLRGQWPNHHALFALCFMLARCDMRCFGPLFFALCLYCYFLSLPFSVFLRSSVIGRRVTGHRSSVDGRRVTGHRSTGHRAPRPAPHAAPRTARSSSHHRCRFICHLFFCFGFGCKICMIHESFIIVIVVTMRRLSTRAIVTLLCISSMRGRTEHEG